MLYLPKSPPPQQIIFRLRPSLLLLASLAPELPIMRDELRLSILMRTKFTAYVNGLTNNYVIPGTILWNWSNRAFFRPLVGLFSEELSTVSGVFLK